MDKNKLFATAIAVTGFAVSVIHSYMRPSIFDQTPTFTLPKADNSVEKTKALTELFKTDAFKEALPYAQKDMIDAIRKIYND